MTKNKNLLLAIVAVIAVIAIYRNPTGSGGAVRDVVDALFGVIQSMFTFTGAVMG